LPINIHGLQKIKDIIRDKPLIAIGGINATNAALVLRCGIDGIAVASAILSANDQIAATEQLHNIVKSSLHSSSIQYACVLSIAGSDSSGGAGTQADIKAIAATGGYAASVITVLTAQNTLGVSSIHNVPAKFVEAQLDSVFADIDFSAVKIGMLYSLDIVKIVAAKLQKQQIKKIVLDPVMVAKSGDKLIANDALAALKKYLFPLVYLITPNLSEAEILVQHPISSLGQMEQAAQELAEMYHTNILIKGGHLACDKCDDVLFCYDKKNIFWFSALRITSKNTHGTGCTFSAAIASYLAQGNSLFDAITKAKNYVTCAISAGSNYLLGHGHGPLHHFANLTLPLGSSGRISN
jgi:hydroxymethylpyrimidine kinase/phosphomethylpyrimidine kinase